MIAIVIYEEKKNLRIINEINLVESDADKK